MLYILAAIVIVAAGIAAYAYFAPRAKERAFSKREGEPLQATTAWTNEAGEEFSGLSESARCDLVFAVAALDDERSQQLLEHALNDPSEGVALAAAHALAGSGRIHLVEAFLMEHPGARADRIAQTLAILGRSAP